MFYWYIGTKCSSQALLQLDIQSFLRKCADCFVTHLLALFARSPGLGTPEVWFGPTGGTVMCPRVRSRTPWRETPIRHRACILATTQHVIMDTSPGFELSIPQLLHALEGKLDRLMKLPTRYGLFTSTGQRGLKNSPLELTSSLDHFRLREDEVRQSHSSPQVKYLTCRASRLTR